jgi:hypothetical protein
LRVAGCQLPDFYTTATSPALRSNYLTLVTCNSSSTQDVSVKYGSFVKTANEAGGAFGQPYIAQAAVDVKRV